MPQNAPPGVERIRAETASKTITAAPKKTGLFGMTPTQMLILGGILLVWLCAMAGFAIYVYFNL